MTVTNQTTAPHQHVETDLALGTIRTGRLTPRAGFWALAGGMATMTAFSTAPSALYGIYQRQDHLSSMTITLIYSVYAVGIIVSLLLVGHVSDWYGRRTVLLPAMLTAVVASLVFASSTSLPALLVGRVITGLALGAAVATATAHLADLDAGPFAPPTRRAQIVATIANVGGLAIGPLLTGVLARFVTADPRILFAMFAALLTLAGAVTALVPEGRTIPTPRPRYHPQRLAVPDGARSEFTAALVGDFLAFTVFGVFAGLASAFLTGTLHRSSPVLAGLAVFIAFGIGLLTQVVTIRWALRPLLGLGIPVLIAGLAVLLSAAWVNPPSLLLFLAGAALAGVGSGAIYRSTLTVVLTTAPAKDRAGALALFFIVGYVGLSLPVVGAGVALLYVSFKTILLIFSAAVAAGILLASPVLRRISSGSGS